MATIRGPVPAYTPRNIGLVAIRGDPITEIMYIKCIWWIADHGVLCLIPCREMAVQNKPLITPMKRALSLFKSVFNIIINALKTTILMLFQTHFLEWKCMNFDKNVSYFFPEGPINNIPALVQIMAWRRTGDKTLSEPMVA